MNAIIDSLGRDVRLVFRGLLRRPAFTFAAVLTLALGIGATTAIFSVVYSVLIKPLPYPNADELVSIRHTSTDVDDLSANSNMYLTYRKENRSFAIIGLWQERDATLTGVDKPERVHALRVSHGTLQTLGVQPMRGRWFTEEEHGFAAEGPEPVILSHAFWQRRFGGDQTAVGRELSIDSRPLRVVGIMPPDFRFLDRVQPDVILAVRLDTARQWHGIYQFQMLGRLKPGVTSTAASADIERLLPIWRDAWPPFPGRTVEDFAKNFADMRIKPVVRPLQDDLVGGVTSTLWVLMGAIGAVLLIACANIANLMLVRADGRRQEFAVRAALGAVPARIARELLAESLVIGALGGALGLVFAYAGLKGLVAIGPSNLPRLEEIAVYPPVLAFTVTVSLASTLVFGSITAVMHALRIDSPIPGATRGSSASRERSAARNTLVVVQVALALVLVVSAALMIRTFQALRHVDPGFSEPSTIQTARIWIPTAVISDPAQYTRVEHEILDRIAVLPGVTSAGFASEVPLQARGTTVNIEVEGQTPVANGTRPPRRLKFVSPGYFKAMGTQMIAGRDVTWSDIETGGRVVVISEDVAREFATEPAGALGKRIRLFPFAQDAWCEVIGVVQSVHEDGLYEVAPSFVYWPVLTENMFSRPMIGTPNVAFAIRSERAGTASLVEEVRQAVRSLNGSIPVAQERTMKDLYAGSLSRTSFALVMLAIAGAMALALGVIGIYGVMAYVVSQRRREIGIRLAVGAQPETVKKMFVLHGLALGTVGIVVGLAAAAVFTRWMTSLLFGVGPLDVTAYVVGVGVIFSAAALASWLPARRAASVNPIETLRAE